MDVFSWSMPFVIEKVTEMLYNVLKYEGVEEKEEQEEKVDVKTKLHEEASLTKKQKIQSLKNKIRSIGKMASLFKTLRQEHEKITILKGL